jgi:hypothetical protein
MPEGACGASGYVRQHCDQIELASANLARLPRLPRQPRMILSPLSLAVSPPGRRVIVDVARGP